MENKETAESTRNSSQGSVSGYVRYTVYKFPSLYGTQKHFRTKLFAWLYAIRQTKYVCELKDNKTGKYVAYWV